MSDRGAFCFLLAFLLNISYFLRAGEIGIQLLLGVLPSLRPERERRGAEGELGRAAGSGQASREQQSVEGQGACCVCGMPRAGPCTRTRVCAGECCARICVSACIRFVGTRLQEHGLNVGLIISCLKKIAI